MNITIKTNFSLSKVNIGEINKIGLVNSGQMLQKIAQANAPYDTGKLKQGIGTDPTSVTNSTKRIRIGPRGIQYAVRREYENYKNPDRKFYMRRTAETGQDIVQKEFEKAVKIVISSL